MEPELIFKLAERNGIGLPYASAEDLRRAHEFADLQSFLNLYFECSRVLRTRQDFHDLAKAYLEKARAQNVVHAEIFFDPQAHMERGVAFATVVDGLWMALGRSVEDCGITTKLIMCILRDRPAESAMQMLEMALSYRDRIIGVGLDSAEAGNPPAKFAYVFSRARAEGFFTVAHAGEEGPPEYVWEALRLLKVSRIDHGVRCMEDPELVTYLRKARVPLTVCPLSNVKLKIVPSLRDHPIKRMFETGLVVTINSDDPAYDGGYIDDNFVAVRDALEFSDLDMRILAENSFLASFLDEDAKQKLIAAV